MTPSARRVVADAHDCNTLLKLQIAKSRSAMCRRHERCNATAMWFMTSGRLRDFKLHPGQASTTSYNSALNNRWHWVCERTFTPCIPGENTAISFVCLCPLPRSVAAIQHALAVMC